MSRFYENSYAKVQNRVPTQYSGVTFDQADSETRELFRSLDDNNKWTMGYWAEKQALKLGVTYGVVFGAILGFFAGFIIASF